MAPTSFSPVGLAAPLGRVAAHNTTGMIFVLRPDLMVLDMSMPGMDGIAVAKIMKVRMPLLPIIMFTNFAEDQFLKKEVLDSGIARLVSKSDAPGLLRAVEDVFRA